MCMSLWAVPQEVLYYRVWSGKPPSPYPTLQSESFHAKPSQNGSRYKHEKVSMMATAQADALKVQNAALAQNKDVLELRRIEVDLEKARKWDGKLPVNMYAGAPMPLLTLQHEK